MHLFKRAHFRGMVHELQRQGLVNLPSTKLAEEMADAVADDMPDEEVRPVTEEDGLSAEEATAAIDKLVDVANAIAAETGVEGAVEINKEAASYDYEKLAFFHADELINKSVKEAADIPGQGGAVVALDATDEAKIDATQNPASAVVGPQGSSAMDATIGAIGKQITRPDQPGAQGTPPPQTIADVKLANVLNKLAMGAGTTAGPNPAGDGSPGADGGQGDGRADLATNLGMGSDVVVPQGQTQQPAPTVPVPLKANPAAAGVTEGKTPTTDLQDDVKTAQMLLSSVSGRQFLRKIAAELAGPQTEKEQAADVLRSALAQLNG